MRNTLRVFITVVAFAVASQAIAANQAHPQPQRLVSISANGSNVNLRTEDGKILEVPASRLAIRNVSRQTGKRGPMSVAELSSMSSAGSLPAIARIRYRADGSVAHVRVRVFGSDAETRAYLQKAAERQANH